MTLEEARKKYIGKKFRLKKDVPLSWKWDWGSGVPYAHIPAGLEGTLTQIKTRVIYPDGWDYSDGFHNPKPKGKPYMFFTWRIEIDGVSKKWYSTDEIEPVN